MQLNGPKLIFCCFRTVNTQNPCIIILVYESNSNNFSQFSEILRCTKLKGARVIGSFRCAKIKGAKNKGLRVLMGMSQLLLKLCSREYKLAHRYENSYSPLSESIQILSPSDFLLLPYNESLHPLLFFLPFLFFTICFTFPPPFIFRLSWQKVSK